MTTALLSYSILQQARKTALSRGLAFACEAEIRDQPLTD